MQLFPTSATQGSSGASDAQGADARAANDPTGGDAFRTALTSARQSTNRAAPSDRKPGRSGASPSGDGGETLEADAADLHDVTPAMLEADALAALLPILTPVTFTPPPLPTVTTAGPAPSNGNAALGVGSSSGQSSPTVESTVGTDFKALPPGIGPAMPAQGQAETAAPTASSVPGAPAAGTAPGVAQAAGAGVPSSASAPIFAPSQAAAIMRLLRPTTGEQSAPASLLANAASTTGGNAVAPPTTEGSSTVAGATASAAATATTAPAPTAPARGPQPMPSISATVNGAPPQSTPTAPSGASTQGLVAAAQALFGNTSNAPTTGTATGPAATTSTWTTPTVQPLGAAQSSTWADFAAEFEARIIAATGPTTTRTAGATGAPAGLTAPADEAAVVAAGSTAEAAGASPAAGVHLPGIAVAGSGNASASTGGTFAESLEASAVTDAAAKPVQSSESPAELHAAIGPTNVQHIGQAQATGDTQPAAATAVPVASQIADAAMTAARRPGQSIEMVLQPEGLGSVSIKVVIERAGLSVHLSVDNAGTRDIVQASWPQLQQAFEQRGLTVQALLLDLSGGRGGSEAFQNFQQFSGQQFGGQQANGQQSAGQQSRNGSASAGGQDTTPSGAIDEGSRPQPGTGLSARVDYRI